MSPVFRAYFLLELFPGSETGIEEVESCTEFHQIPRTMRAKYGVWAVQTMG